jgi:hypothetical protein
VAELTIETLAESELEAHERIRELESDCKTYKMLAVAGLECIAQLTKRNKQLACRIDHLNGQLREILAAPCLTCRRAQRSGRAA